MLINGVAVGNSVDTETIIQTYLTRWRQQYVSPVQTQHDTRQTEASALASIPTYVSNIQSKLLSLKSGSAFLASTAVSSNESMVTAASDSTASTGTYNINVTQLAKQHKVASGQFTNTGTDISSAGTGTMTFDITVNGDVKNINVAVNAGDNNQTVLQNIAGAINTSGIAATAIVVNETGSSSRLVVSSNTTGLANAISMQDTGGNTLLLNSQVLNGTGGYANELQASKDALFTVDSLNFQRSGNTVSDAISGVTLQLKGEGGSSQLNIKVDTTAITSSIQSFLDEYNTLVDYLKTSTSYNVDTKAEGTLLHYPEVRNMSLMMRPSATDPVAGLPDAFNSLYMIGITADKDGKLSISDSAKLSGALSTNLSDVQALFNTPTTGIAVRLSDYYDNITSANGSLTTTVNYTNDEVQQLSDEIDAQNRTLAAYETSLRAKYGALDSLLTTNQAILSTLSGYSLMPTIGA